MQPNSINVSPNSAPVGQNVLVTGKGFTPNGSIGVTIGGAYAPIVSGNTADPSGNVSALVTVPSLATNTYAVVVKDNASGLSASYNQFYVTGTASGTATATSTPYGGAGNLTASPNSGSPSIAGGTPTTITLSGYNLPASTQVTGLYLVDGNGHSISLSPSVTSTTSAGTYSATVTLPGQAAGGTGSIELIVGSTVATATFTVTPVFLINGHPATSSSPAQVLAGQSVQITGAGFKANTIISFLVNINSTLQTSPSTVATDAYGNLSASAVVPSNLTTGTYYITSQDQSGNEQVTAFVSILTGTLTPTATSTPSITPSPTWTPYGYIAPSATPTLTPYGYVGATSTPSATATSQVPATTDYFAEGYTGQAATNGKATFTEVLNILNPNPSIASATITYYIEGSTTPVVVTRQLPADTMQREVVNSDVGPDKAVAAIVTSPQALVVTRTITRIAAGGARLDGSTTQPVHAASATWAFPEGYTGITFQEYLTLLNPGAIAATVTLVLAPQATSSAGARTLTLTVPPLSRTTTSVRALNAGDNVKSVGMLITSNVPIVAERVEYFGDGSGSGKFGSSVSSGFTTPATDLRIPYATSGGSAPDSTGHQQPVGDQAYVTLLNPSPGGSPAQVTVGFGDNQGHPLGQTTQVTVAPGTRQTVVVNTAIGVSAAGPLSIAVSSTVGIVAELAQYYGGSPNVGAHPGVVIPAFSGAMTDAFLSDLSTQLEDGTPEARTAYIYNPGTTSEQVAATYYGLTGSTAQAVYTVPAGGITTVNVNGDTSTTIPAGAVGAEFKLAAGSSGSFIVSSVGVTADHLSATEDVGVPLP